ncbi:sosondowah ankyrin repeat domain family Cb isoform X1 [Takifugu rubripes]|uniref:sosondowah ankyrin repeat domain family Cb isoform X1 n=1 Tax=Takifugu rubripes TaxID=31033 RepID=UPI0005D23E33|nr:ankyrin repeat domain-containing protein SOWAHC-like isoform X1 [Takifugu rubripes]|eukprot:XP_011604343.1 PREDICTED: ankyrin repeat domain-containing protein SOWAHC-like isoform X1 [Takifugu rubripes]
MDAESSSITVEQILNFLKETGGKVTNADLIERFRTAIPEEPEKKAAARLQFKTCVNNVAFVRLEDGVKYVCLRRKFAKEDGNSSDMLADVGRYSAGVCSTDAGDGGAPGSGYGSDNQEKLKQPDEVDADGQSLSGSEGGVSPKSSRRHFLQSMMSSSPHVRHSLVLRSDGDSTSLDDDRPAVTLDPLEHEWMLCASDGEWSTLQRLLSAEPSLILRKDFITGFTCLHWAAKQGKPELLALVINFAKQNNLSLSVDVRSNAGYTPLHVAAMQNHLEVLKLLVGAYNADVEIRDYSGRKACQYLAEGVSVDIREILGACPDRTHHIDRSRPSFSKVFHANLRILSDPVDVEVRAWEKPLRRKSSFTKMKPKLEKLRRRASQLIHSTTFHEEEVEEGPVQSFFHLRPKTHEFG